ncbi:MAG: antibiotic biosynthesis monooxygenase [Phycisphaerae bacterium]|nr:antibiotic biosynthesis monooxygenase [Phycisphaerae bacterium]
MQVPPAVRERVVKSLLRLVGPTRAMKGCTACATYVDVEDENILVYVEEWETQEALVDRLRAEDLRVLLSVMDLSSERPVVRFDTIIGTQGMEVIAAARAAAAP